MVIRIFILSEIVSKINFGPVLTCDSFHLNQVTQYLQFLSFFFLFFLFPGGIGIQDESKEIIKKNGGPLPVAKAVFTGSGNLPCQHIIHVAGPKWERGPLMLGEETTVEEEELHDSVTDVLRVASRRKLQSISIPAISAGVFGFPLDLSAKTILEATIDFCRNRKPSLKEIRFTNINQRACDAFLAVFLEFFGEEMDASGTLGKTEYLIKNVSINLVYMYTEEFKINITVMFDVTKLLLYRLLTTVLFLSCVCVCVASKTSHALLLSMHICTCRSMSAASAITGLHLNANCIQMVKKHCFHITSKVKNLWSSGQSIKILAK